MVPYSTFKVNSIASLRTWISPTPPWIAWQFSRRYRKNKSLMPPTSILKRRVIQVSQQHFFHIIFNFNKILKFNQVVIKSCYHCHSRRWWCCLVQDPRTERLKKKLPAVRCIIWNKWPDGRHRLTRMKRALLLPQLISTRTLTINVSVFHMEITSCFA